MTFHAGTAELIDRLVIELRKQYWAGASEQLKDIQDELSQRLGAPQAQLVSLVAQLASHNADIWVNEWAIRSARKLPLEELGRRAILTRHLNDDRCATRQAIARLLGEIPEARVYGFPGYLEEPIDAWPDSSCADSQEPGVGDSR